jgi:hypothetical protein
MRPERFCLVDYYRYEFAKNHDWYLHCYAAALVHEATHGSVYSHYVPVLERNRLRIERLCRTEEIRFLRRLDTPDRCWSEQIAGAFNEQWFSDYYNRPWFSRAISRWKRIAEVKKRG